MENYAVEEKLGGLDLVMLTYNREDTIERALQSVSRIKFNSIICVDHHSRDRTLEIICKYYPDSKILYEDKGLGYARTIAIQQVRSPFFLFLDSDVVLPHSFLESIARYLGKKVGAIQGKRQVDLPFWGRMIEERTPKSGYRVLDSHDRPFTGATLIRTSAVRGADVSRYMMMEDYFLMRHVQKNGYLWVEAVVPFKNLQSSMQAYGNVSARLDENEGAAMRLYGIKSPSLFAKEQIKYTIRDLYYAIKQGRIQYVTYVIRLHRNFLRGYIAPRRYLS